MGLMTTTMSEPSIQADREEAWRLYQRGVAAARAGQRRVAAGLLTRSVRLNPAGEMAWLWLSGVLDDPEQQSFCLQAVLNLNPQNPHALRGVRLLEERGLPSGSLRPAASLSMPPAPSAYANPEQRESWWVGFRRNRREMSRARLLLWAFPIALLCLAILLYESFALALTRSMIITPPAAELAYGATVAVPPLRPTLELEAVLEAEPIAVVESLAAGYLSALDPVRTELRTATAAYHAATTQTAGGSVAAVTATQHLRAAVARAIETITTLNPPATLRQAHDDYLHGLSLQQDGLDALVEFYAGYNVANANRAAINFQEARAYIDRARGAFDAQTRQMIELSTISSQTVR